MLCFSRAHILVSLRSSSKYLLKLVGLPARRLWQQSHGLLNEGRINEDWVGSLGESAVVLGVALKRSPVVCCVVSKGVCVFQPDLESS